MVSLSSMASATDFDQADVYCVGGAVRDRLLGLAVHDRDYVVIGATPAQMLAWGFTQVGNDFPVFLHPVSHEEYALARTERKQGQGYKGFVFSTENVTLEEDLKRRDLTINAIAEDKQGHVIDPYHGQIDLNRRILRHVSAAFREDPVRLLRVARFAARFEPLGFTVAKETIQLMQQMVDDGEAANLVPERVTTELFKALDSKAPQVFFNTLRACGALKVIFPEIDALFGVPQCPEYHPEVDTGVHVMMALADAAKRNASRFSRYAVLCHDLGKATTPKAILPAHHGHEMRGIAIANTMSKRLKLPKSYREIGAKSAQYHTHIHNIAKLKASTTVELLKAFGVSKDLTLFSQFVDSCIADSRGRIGFENSDYPQAQWALKMAYAFQQFDAKPFIKNGMTSEHIKSIIKAEHIRLLNSIRTSLKLNTTE